MVSTGVGSAPDKDSMHVHFRQHSRAVGLHDMHYMQRGGIPPSMPILPSNCAVRKRQVSPMSQPGSFKDTTIGRSVAPLCCSCMRQRNQRDGMHVDKTGLIIISFRVLQLQCF